MASDEKNLSDSAAHPVSFNEGGRVPANLLVKQTRSKTMTPVDIAAEIEDIGSVGGGNVNWSTNATYCCSGGVANVADDQRTWD